MSSVDDHLIESNNAITRAMEAVDQCATGDPVSLMLLGQVATAEAIQAGVHAIRDGVEWFAGLITAVVPESRTESKLSDREVLLGVAEAIIVNRNSAEFPTHATEDARAAIDYLQSIGRLS